MAIVSIETLKSYFETGDKPTQSQFVDLIDTLASLPANGNANITSINVEGIQLLRSTGALSTVTFYNVTNAVGVTKVLQVYATANNTNLVCAVDVATGKIGTYNITTDVFISVQPYSTLPTAPTSAEDETKGYEVGYTVRAVDKSIEYICTSNATGAAVWNAQSGLYTATVTPDGDVVTIAELPIALQSKNGDHVSVSIKFKASFDFTGDTTGGIAISLPFPTTTLLAIGQASIVGTAPGVSSPIELSVSDNGRVIVYCADSSYTGGSIFIKANFNYLIN